MLPLFPVTRSGGNEADISPTLGIDDGEADGVEFSDDDDPFFTAFARSADLDRRPVPDAFGIAEVDAVLFDVGSVFVFIPLKLHYLSVAQTCTRF